MRRSIALILACPLLAAAEGAATHAAVAAGPSTAAAVVPLRDPFTAPGLSGELDPDAPDWPRVLAIGRRGGGALALLSLGGERVLLAVGEGATLSRRRFVLKDLAGEEVVVAEEAGGERRLRVLVGRPATP